ncbi:hypothetical protein SAMN04487905_101494 [Actinopolyspora xinjiangensis]|uniref:PH domain-containing protein n=1 Tax=Actinopolyspora xinjiangensis TaxID=405564 RepID=A0A1H0PCS1_9ACTN|nr:STM3941 family protein [Actinopolyspora xinjiangensis]SDP02882.1 hypothetical protein SAMN04487905_101494 [Actinopolyspora xinjiangensis]
MGAVQRTGHPGQRNYRLAVYPNRTRMALVVLGALAFVLFGLFICYQAITAMGSAPLAGFFLALSALAIVFFGGCLIYGVVRLARPKPVVVLDNEGLHDHASFTGVGFVGWGEISGAMADNDGVQRLLSVTLFDPREVLDRTTGWRGFLVRVNARMMGTPVNISQNMVAMPISQLAAEIRLAAEKATVDR